MVKKEIKKDLNLTILELLNQNIKPKQISIKLNISMPLLSYYLRKLKKNGNIKKIGYGTWEVKNYTWKVLTKQVKIIRGHAYIFEVNLPKEIKGWDKRIDVLKQNNIHYKLVGAKLTTPRIKILGRKVWLCNDHLRIFDKKDESYYAESSVAVSYTHLTLPTILLV